MRKDIKIIKNVMASTETEIVYGIIVEKEYVGSIKTYGTTVEFNFIRRVDNGVQESVVSIFNKAFR